MRERSESAPSYICTLDETLATVVANTNPLRIKSYEILHPAPCEFSASNLGVVGLVQHRLHLVLLPPKRSKAHVVEQMHIDIEWRVRID